MPIVGYTKVVPVENYTSYEVEGRWGGDHFVSGPHYLGYSHKTDPEAAFKCQYVCNADESCRAYFVQYVAVNTEDEHAECTLYDALISSAIFLPASNATIGGGAYDKLCK
ncbi:hypothetical protein B0T16DRAFT_346113 [Cercophora newfieldiana]|uniref:Uncharacterized protein n=1 Tax=Cercophora newfieldiana TaxID=92897 RepID=A0AA40CVE1_9PEZI|nr:hypothetical protein B0T16DRAFT_346113 [Cercophora newfieldiana]